MDQTERYARFEYDPEFVKYGIQPASLCMALGSQSPPNIKTAASRSCVDSDGVHTGENGEFHLTIATVS